MLNFDELWKYAPQGATQLGVTEGGIVRWLKDNGERSYMGGDWLYNTFNWAIISERVVSGKAGRVIPPVGTKCMYRIVPSSNWWHCEIISHDRLVLDCPHLAENEGGYGLQVINDSTEIEFRDCIMEITNGQNEMLNKFCEFLSERGVETSHELKLHLNEFTRFVKTEGI